MKYITSLDLDLKNKNSLLFFYFFLFLFVNPFYLIAILACVNIFLPNRDRYFYFISFLLAFSYYFRDYGVSWSVSSNDDVINYISQFDLVSSYSFFDLISNYIANPSGNEIGWLAYNWLLSFFCDKNDFVFITYLFIFFFTLVVVSSLNYEKIWFVLFAYFFFSIDTLMSSAHIWRQQFAFLTFVYGSIGFFKSKSYKWYFIILLSAMFHTSAFIYIFILMAYNLIAKVFTGYKLLIAVLSISILGSLALANSEYVISIFLYSDLRDKLLANIAGDNTDRSVFIFINIIILCVYFCLLFFKKFDYSDFEVFSFFCYAFGVIFMLISKNSNAIYDRILFFTTPMASICIAKMIINHYQRSLGVVFFLFVSLLAFYKIFRSIYITHEGVFPYLLHGGFQDPTFGFLKMIFEIL